MKLLHMLTTLCSRPPKLLGMLGTQIPVLQGERETKTESEFVNNVQCMVSGGRRRGGDGRGGGYSGQ